MTSDSNDLVFTMKFSGPLRRVVSSLEFFAPKISTNQSDHGIPDQILRDIDHAKFGVGDYAYVVMGERALRTRNSGLSNKIVFNRRVDQSTYQLCEVSHVNSNLSLEDVLEWTTVRSFEELITFIAHTNPYTETGRVDQWCHYNNSLVFLADLYTKAMSATLLYNSSLSHYKCIEGVEHEKHSDNHCKWSFVEDMQSDSTDELYVSFNSTVFATPLNGKHSVLPDLIMKWFFHTKAINKDAAYQEPLPTTVLSIHDGKHFQVFLECKEEWCYDATQFYIR